MRRLGCTWRRCLFRQGSHEDGPILSIPLPTDGQSIVKSSLSQRVKLPQHMYVERELLCDIADGLPPEAALRRLPWNTLFLYFNAAQSIIFNAVLSKRLQRSGTAPVAGDLYQVRAQQRPDGKQGNSIGPRPFGVDAQAAASRLGSLQSAVLPLPGRAVTYPDHMRDAYEIASQEMSGLPLKVFHDDDSFIPLEVHTAILPWCPRMWSGNFFLWTRLVI